MNEKTAIDTNAYSQLFRGDTLVLELISTAEVVYMPVTVLGELLAGFRIGSRENRNRKELEEFLGKPTVRVLETTQNIADIYAGLVADLRKAGRKIPTNDIWIAAHAISEGAVLISYDKHFLSVPGLRMANFE